MKFPNMRDATSYIKISLGVLVHALHQGMPMQVCSIKLNASVQMSILMGLNRMTPVVIISVQGTHLRCVAGIG